MSTRNLCQLSTSFHSQGEVMPTAWKARRRLGAWGSQPVTGVLLMVVLTAAEMMGLLLQGAFIKYQG